MKNRPSLVAAYIIIGSMLVTSVCYLSFIGTAFSTFESDAIPLAVKYNRWGLFFQILSIFSILPDLIGKERTEKWETSFRDLTVQINDELALLKRYELDAGFGLLLKKDTSVISLFSEFAKFIFFGYWLFMFVTIPGGLVLVTEQIFAYVTLGILFVTWICLKSILHIFPKKQLYIFRIVYLILNKILTFFTLPLAIGIAYLSKPIIPLVNKIARYPIKTVFIRVTFPLLLVGTILQFLATFQ